MISFFKRIFKWVNSVPDPLKDPRCKGCVHVDGPICDYPYCKMIKDNDKKI